jgi:dipeptidyl aminopeptidase/acylaminoacyl peptidase
VQAVLRVRKVANTSVADDASLTVPFEGRPADWRMLTFMSNVAFPFQKAYERHGLPVFRASWAPDGTKLVFSDGLNLRVWTIGQNTTVIIPGTDDGVLPAWSPDGNWIAFTKLFRGPVQNIVCFCVAPGASTPYPRYDRTIYSGGSREDGELMLVRPDGSELKPLGLGEAPAWTPDSRTIVAHRDFRLFRITVESEAASEIPNTLNGFEPAISRDGRWLAFVKIAGPELNPDIWVVPF